MPEEVLTVAELERLAARGEPEPGLDWSDTLARVCRHALALHKQVEVLTGLSEVDVNTLLERWDQTEPAIQRGIVARLASLLAVKRHEVHEDDGDPT